MIQKPTTRPLRPYFSSGPCAKHPQWSFDNLKDAFLSRSHRAKGGKAKLQEAIDLTREVLCVPQDYEIGIVPASDTGAVEMALWTMLGARGVDMLAWESFGEGWVTDVVKQLKIEDCRVFKAPYGEIVDFSQVDSKTRDVVFTWNGTTSGVMVPNANWIAADREGIIICDATSAAFAQPLDFPKLDVVTFSWQKALGSEAAHGIIILSPRAVERLESYTPSWPVPKIFRMTKGGKLIEGIFVGETINTPSMLCTEDYIDALKWAKSIGGLPTIVKRTNVNLKVIETWVEKSSWADFLAKDAATRSNTSVCLSIKDLAFRKLPKEDQAKFAKQMASLLEKEGVAYDVGSYRDAPPGLRIWCGATIEQSDIQALLPWLDWAFATTLADFKKA